MSASKSPPPVMPERTGLELEELPAAQIEFLDDLRTSLTEMKQGKVQPARAALHEIRRDLETENNGNRPNG